VGCQWYHGTMKNRSIVPFLLILLPSLFCCSVPEEPRFSSAFTGDIEAAERVWRVALGSEADKLVWPSYVATYSDYVPEELSRTALAYTYEGCNPTVYFAVDHIVNTFFRAKFIALHEIGHALGLHHGDGWLMVPTYGVTYRCIDDDTLDKLARVRGLDRTRMHEACF